MDEYQTLLFCIEQTGVIAFSISGAMTAVEDEFDLFGVWLLGLLTALGGGMMRDTLLGLVPSGNFYNYTGIALSLVSSLLVFLVAYRNQDYYFSHAEEIENFNNAADAIGLGLFTVNGVQATLNAGFGDNLFLVVFMGMLTGVGGGLIRDIIAKRKPMIIRKHIYAVAALLGSLCYLYCISHGVEEIAAIMTSLLLVFFIRMLSARYKLNLPRIRRT